MYLTEQTVKVHFPSTKGRNLQDITSLGIASREHRLAASRSRRRRARGRRTLGAKRGNRVVSALNGTPRVAPCAIRRVLSIRILRGSIHIDALSSVLQLVAVVVLVVNVEDKVLELINEGTVVL